MIFDISAKKRLQKLSDMINRGLSNRIESQTLNLICTFMGLYDVLIMSSL